MIGMINASAIANLSLLSIITAVLVACSSSKPPVQESPNIFPADYKAEILNTMSTSLDNPTNVRGAFISDPIMRRAGTEERYAVCVRADTLNAFNQYAGSKDRIAFFYAGHINQLIDATKEQCGNTPYKPFPELEHLCQAKKCV
jgi:hypothetical protein